MSELVNSEAVLSAITALVKEIIVLEKDGFQWSDAVALGSKLAMDEAFRKTIIDGCMAVTKVGPEVQGVTLGKILELAQFEIAQITK